MRYIHYLRVQWLTFVRTTDSCQYYVTPCQCQLI